MKKSSGKNGSMALEQMLARIEAQAKTLAELRKLEDRMLQLLRRAAQRDDLTVKEALEIWKVLHPKL